MIQKELNEADGDYKCTAAQKSHFDSDKRTLKFVGKIQVMTVNNSSKSIRFIGRDMRVSEFLIRQLAHENIWYFSYKMRKHQFSLQAMKNKRKDCTAKLLNKLKGSLQSNMLWLFSDEKIFCQD